MNKRMRKKNYTKKPSNRQKVKWYKQEVKELAAQNDAIYDKALRVSCEKLKLKRQYDCLNKQFSDILTENFELKNEINVLEEDHRCEIERLRGLVTKSDIQVAGYKAQLEMLDQEARKPFWKKVLGK